MASVKYPDISVVVPWGKREGNAEQCLRSVLVQTLTPLEVIVVLNGDVPFQEARELIASINSPLIRVMDLPGCSNANQARNYGAQLAKGEWVAYLDSDDAWDAGHLLESVTAASANGADMVYSGMRIALPNDKVVELVAGDFREEGGMENYLLEYKPAQTSSFLVRRSCILRHKWAPRLRRHQDYELLSRLAQYVPITHKTNITVSVDWRAPRRHKAHADCFLVLKTFKPNLRKDLYKRHFLFLFRSARRSNDPVWIYHVPEFLFVSPLPRFRRLRRLGAKTMRIIQARIRPT